MPDKYMIRRGFKVFSARNEILRSAIERGDATCEYAMKQWNYALCGPLFVFDLEKFARRLSHTLMRCVYRPVWYVQIEPRINVIQSVFNHSDSQAIEATKDFWRKGPSTGTAVLSLPPGTVFASAVWIGEEPYGPLDILRLDEIRELFNKEKT